MFRYNKLYQIIGICCLLFYSQLSMAQIPDSVANAIKTTLLNKEVSEKVFFYYDNERRGYGHLGPGNFAFVCPDTTFQRVYKGILDEFPYWDSITYKIKFYKDSEKAIFIEGVLEPELMIVFQKINVTSSTAEISFFTTSSPKQERFQDRYVQVTSHLRKVQGKWEVAKCKIKPIKWSNYLE